MILKNNQLGVGDNMNDTLNVKFQFIENKFYDDNVNEIKLEILGQEFIEKFYVDKKFANRIGEPAWDRERARLFGMKLHEIGLMIQLQAEKGKTQDIKFCEGGVNERILHCF